MTAVAIAIAAAAVAVDAETAGAQPIVVVRPAVVGLGGAAIVAVAGFDGGTLEVRLVGATTAYGRPTGWTALALRGRTWLGQLPRPASLGVYPIVLRARPGARSLSSRLWLVRVLAPGTLDLPSFDTPEGVARWWVRTMPGHARLVALKRWQQLASDLRDRRLHQLLLVAYVLRGRTRIVDRLGVFITAFRDGYSGRWRLLEATVLP